MNIEVIEFEIRCPAHGVYRVQVPAELPRPRACVHCYAPVERRELRRFTTSLAAPAGPSEAFIG